MGNTESSLPTPAPGGDLIKRVDNISNVIIPELRSRIDRLATQSNALAQNQSNFDKTLVDLSKLLPTTSTAPPPSNTVLADLQRQIDALSQRLSSMTQTSVVPTTSTTTTAPSTTSTTEARVQEIAAQLDRQLFNQLIAEASRLDRVLLSQIQITIEDEAERTLDVALRESDAKTAAINSNLAAAENKIVVLERELNGVKNFVNALPSGDSIVSEFRRISQALTQNTSQVNSIGQTVQEQGDGIARVDRLATDIDQRLRRRLYALLQFSQDQLVTGNGSVLYAAPDVSVYGDRILSNGGGFFLEPDRTFLVIAILAGTGVGASSCLITLFDYDNNAPLDPSLYGASNSSHHSISERMGNASYAFVIRPTRRLRLGFQLTSSVVWNGQATGLLARESAVVVFEQ
jgi:hypothetical protein